MNKYTLRFLTRFLSFRREDDERLLERERRSDSSSESSDSACFCSSAMVRVRCGFRAGAARGLRSDQRSSTAIRRLH